MDQVQQIEKPTGVQITVHTLQEVCVWIKHRYGHDYYAETGLNGSITGYVVHLLRVMFTRGSQGVVEFKQEDLDVCFQSLVAEPRSDMRKDLNLFSQFVEDLLDEFGNEHRCVYIWNYKGV